jgi:hypothetical protein
MSQLMIIAAAKDAILVQIGVLYKRRFMYLNDYGSLLLLSQESLVMGCRYDLQARELYCNTYYVI